MTPRSGHWPLLASALLGLACGARPHPTPQDPAPASASAAPSAPAPAPASASASAPAPAPAPASAAPRASASAAPRPAGTSRAPAGASLEPLPKEPWYHDKPERIEECVEPIPVPARHFPSPFEACNPAYEAWNSPPGSHELHFHYRFFSVELTSERRKTTPEVCCYMIFEFPSYRYRR